MYPALRGEEHLAEHKWRGCDDVGDRLDLVGQTVIVGHVLFHSFLDDDMGRGAENLALNVFPEAGHDADRPNQRCHPQRNSSNRHERIQRDGPVATLGAQIAESNKDFVGKGHSYAFSGRS